MHIAVLGPIELVDDDGTVHGLTSRAQQVIVGVLALEPNRWVATDAVIDAVWGEAPPPSALSSLRAQISRLRRLLGDALEGGVEGYRLRVDHDAIDAARLDAALRPEPGVERPAERAELVEALADWRGAPYAGFESHPVLGPEAARLRVRRLDAMARVAELAMDAGDTGEAIVNAEAVLALDALREATWVTLIRALAADQRSAEALRAFQRAGDALADVGLAPGEALCSAEADVISPDSSADQLPREDRQRPRRMPPAPLNPLVGRDTDLEHLIDVSRRSRLVTLIGPGGVGKTRLAVEAARLLASEHHGGAVVVRLARLGAGETDAVETSIADALEVADVDAAGDLDVLVVIDNCEHVADAAARAAAQLLGGSGRVHIVATSRERLRIDGEQVVVLDPLATDDASSAGVDLLVARAESAGVSLDRDDSVIELARRLDGLPLAIEMAAARVGTHTPAEILDELVSDPGAFGQNRRDLDERHRTLETVISWSEQLLPESARDAFAELSVFAGPVTRVDLVGVLSVDRPTDAIDELVSQSLLRVDTRTTPSTFRTLDTIRSHAAMRLDDADRGDEMRRRHAQWFVDEMRDVNASVCTVDEPEARVRFDSMFDELRVAHRWAVAHDPELAATMSQLGHVCAQESLRGEFVDWAEHALETVPDPHPSRRALHGVLSAGLATRGRLDDAVRHADLVAEEPDRDLALLQALEGRTDTALYAGRLDECRASALEGIDLATELGQLHYIDIFRSAVALAYAYGEDNDAAIASLDVAPACNRPSSEAWLAYSRGEALMEDDPAASLAELQRAIALSRASGNRMIEGVSTVSASSLRARSGDTDEALQAFAGLLDEYADTGDRSHQLTTLKNLVVLFDRLGTHVAVAALGSAVNDDPRSPTYGAEAERLSLALEHARRSLGPDEFVRAQRSGEPQTLDELVELARGEIDALLAGG